MAGFLFLGLTVGLVIVCRLSGNQIARDVSVLLLIQFALANFFYEHQQVEVEETILSMLVVGLWAMWLRIAYAHWLPVFVLICAIAISLWTLAVVSYEFSPFAFKAAKNAIFAVEVLACLSVSLALSSSRGSSC